MNDKELTDLIEQIYKLALPQRTVGRARQLQHRTAELRAEWKRRMERQKAKESRYV